MVDQNRIRKTLNEARYSANQARADRYRYHHHLSWMENQLDSVVLMTQIKTKNPLQRIVYDVNPYLDEMVEIEGVGYIYHPEQVKLQKAQNLYKQGEIQLGEIALKLAQLHALTYIPPLDLTAEINQIKSSVSSLNNHLLIDPSFQKCQIIKPDSYPFGMDLLRQKGKEPFSVADNLKARLADPQWYDTWLDSNTAIVYKKQSSAVIIIQNSDLLKNIHPNFNNQYLPITSREYVQLQKEGKTLDTNNFKCNELLTIYEILGSPPKKSNAHPLLLALAGDDYDLLSASVKDIFHRYLGK